MLFCLHPFMVFFVLNLDSSYYFHDLLIPANICLCSFLKIPCVFELQFFYVLSQKLVSAMSFFAISCFSYFLPTDKLILTFFDFFSCWVYARISGYRVPLQPLRSAERKHVQKPFIPLSRHAQHIPFILCLQLVLQNILG